MSSGQCSIFPLGESAITVEFGREISVGLNERAINVASYFELNPFPGLIETTASYASVTLFYDPAVIRDEFDQFETAFDAILSLISRALEETDAHDFGTPETVEIPVDFSALSGPDLGEVSAFAGLETSDIIDVFTARIYRVYMLGFLPGFAYMGEVDPRVAIGRKATPRTKVPKGSVGIAGTQTGIYPLESPGGWQIIGRTATEMFDPSAEEPCLLRPGDLVKFVDIRR
jgi:inhibitor of KinA